MKNIKKLFKNKKPFVIGMIHCAPLLGYKNFPGVKQVKKKFEQDMAALIKGGVDSIMIENNYDIPHYECAKRSTIPILTKLCLEARQRTNKPLGLSILWNDYETALSIAKIADFNFVRIPVFVDKVKTDYGIFNAKANECLSFRKKIKADTILIFADVQVKHAEHLIKRPLARAVKEASDKKADGIIITGKWTGDPPNEEDVKEAKKSALGLPIILGSGVTPKNIKKYGADGIIIGSYFKGKGNPKEKHYHNIFPWKSAIKKDRVKRFMNSLKK
ncbi:MAG: BtpA/SgcQ family protein [Patescibacteria group bacterium]